MELALRNGSIWLTVVSSGLIIAVETEVPCVSVLLVGLVRQRKTYCRRRKSRPNVLITILRESKVRKLPHFAYSWRVWATGKKRYVPPFPTSSAMNLVCRLMKYADVTHGKALTGKAMAEYAKKVYRKLLYARWMPKILKTPSVMPFP